MEFEIIFSILIPFIGTILGSALIFVIKKIKADPNTVPTKGIKMLNTTSNSIYFSPFVLYQVN